MAQRILVFESDPAFAREIQENFERLGAQVEVVDDGNVGIERATSARPDLILLSIELPQMNGFLVCKKIKKSGELKDIPLVILSSEATEEIFEQHKKLRTRAEDYIHKPVTFDALLERVQLLVPIGQNGGAMEETLDIEDVTLEEEVVEDVPPPAAAAEPQRAKSVDAEIDAFADNAFSNLVMDEDEQTSIASAPEMEELRKAASDKSRKAKIVAPPPEPVAEPEPPPAPVEDAPVAQAAPEPEPSRRRSVAPGAADAAELERLREKLTALESMLERAQSEAHAATRKAAEADRLERELADMKSKPAPAPAKGGGISSREFLDLREALNKKDKEILDLKDQVSARDKQLIEGSDKMLSLERLQADRDDRISALEDDLTEATQRGDALASDKEAANKRADDLKGRLERADQKGKKLEEDLDAERKAHAADVERVGRERAEAVSALEERYASDSARAAAKSAADAEAAAQRHADELRRTREAAATELAETKGAAATELAETKDAAAGAALSAAERNAAEIAEIKSTHAGEVARTAERHSEELATLKAAHAAESEENAAEATASKAAALEALREDLVAESDQKLREADAAREQALAALRQELDSKYAGELQVINDKNSRDLALLGRKLAETESSLTVTQERLENTETAKAESERQLGERVASLEADLATRTDERDMRTAELAAARASIGELEKLRDEHTARIRVLEDRVADLDTRVTRAVTKVKDDDELLERTRRALAIALSLLEDQQKNTL